MRTEYKSGQILLGEPGRLGQGVAAGLFEKTAVDIPSACPVPGGRCVPDDLPSPTIPDERERKNRVVRYVTKQTASRPQHRHRP